MYGKIIEGYLYYAPKDFKTNDGELIVNFNNNEELMILYGYKKVIDNPPEVNRFNQRVVLTGYDETEDTITKKYTIIDNKPKPSLEQRVTSLEKGIDEIMIIFDEEVNN